MQRPFPAYEGPDAYVFVCYAHADAASVYPELLRLRDAGFNVWYDEGISPGSEWTEALARHIEHCAVFLYFITPTSVAREHCRREVAYALDQKRAVLAVHLEPTELPSALRLSLANRQAILRYELSAAMYRAKLDEAVERAASGRVISDLAEGPMAIGDWQVDFAAGTLACGNAEAHLPPQTMAVLAYLAGRPGELVTNDELLQHVWQGRVIGDDSVYQHIGRIRKALGDDSRAPSYIETIPRRGYRLIAAARAVEPALPEDPAPAAATAGEQQQRDAGRRRAAVTVAVSVLVALIAARAWWWRAPEEMPPAIVEPVVAGTVLPISFRGSDEEGHEFARTLTMSLRDQLSKVSALRVVDPGPDSEGADPVEVATRVGADFALAGALETDGVGYRFETSLLRAADGQQTWTSSFPGSAEELVADLGELALAVAQALRTEVTEQESRRLQSPATLAPAALRLFQRARQLPPFDGARKELLEQAIAFDPGFAEAHAELAWHHLWAVMLRRDRDQVSVARELAERALVLDPELAWGHFVMGWVLFAEGRLRSAQFEMRRAIQLDPSNRFVLQDTSALLISAANLEEAADLAYRAVLTAPHDKNTRWHLGLALNALGDHARVRAWCEATLAATVEPVVRYGIGGHSRCELLLPQVAILRGEVEAARKLAVEVLNDPDALVVAKTWAVRSLWWMDELEPTRTWLAQESGVRPGQRGSVLMSGSLTVGIRQAILLQRAGESAAAEAFLNEAEVAAARRIEDGSEWSEPRLQLAAVNAIRGNPIETISWLEQAYAAGYRDYLELELSPVFDGMRDDAGFRRLVARIKDDLAHMRDRLERDGLLARIDAFIAAGR